MSQIICLIIGTLNLLSHIYFLFLKKFLVNLFLLHSRLSFPPHYYHPITGAYATPFDICTFHQLSRKNTYSLQNRLSIIQLPRGANCEQDLPQNFESNHSCTVWHSQPIYRKPECRSLHHTFKAQQLSMAHLKVHTPVFTTATQFDPLNRSTTSWLQQLTSTCRALINSLHLHETMASARLRPHGMDLRMPYRNNCLLRPRLRLRRPRRKRDLCIHGLRVQPSRLDER